MQGFGLDYAYGQKRRDFNAGGCGPVGCDSGTRLPGGCARPPMLPGDEDDGDDGLRFGNDLRSSLLPDAVFQYRLAARPGRSDQHSYGLVADAGFHRSSGPFPIDETRPKSVQGATSAITFGRQYHPSNLIIPSISD